jgi:hypothetical protein
MSLLVKNCGKKVKIAYNEIYGKSDISIVFLGMR